MIDIRNLRFSYLNSTFSLDIPKLGIATGEKVALIGPSGSGKTTFISLVAGILVSQEGAIQLDGCDIGKLTDKMRRNFRISRIGFVFQELELLEYLTVADNILLPYRINSSLSCADPLPTAAQKAAQAVGLADKLNRYPGTLSQGEKQRVAVCRALITLPAIIIADEPTGNLDPENSGLIMNLLIQQAQQRNTTLLVVTHNHSNLDRFDRVIDIAQYARRGDL